MSFIASWWCGAYCGGMAAVMLVMAFHGFLQLFGWDGRWPVFIDLGAFFVAMLAAKVTYKVANRVPAEA